MRRGFMSMAGAVLAAASMGIAAPVAVAASPAVSSPVAPAPTSKAVVPSPERKQRARRKAPKGWRATYRANGKREVARRLRQIASGQITASNGLAA